ncbi:MAG: hypothetical protein AB1540_11955, partial [Bdellovibrionota bacterium]
GEEEMKVPGLFLSAMALFSISLNALAESTPKPTDGGEGSDAGNGGQLIVCQPVQSDPDQKDRRGFDGLYSIDYIVAVLARGGDETKIVGARSWHESYLRIYNRLQLLDKKMAADFAEFNNLRHNYTDMSLPQIWIDQPYGVINRKAESLVERLPKECMQGENVQTEQVVWREESNGLIKYKHDRKRLTDLEMQLPLMYSFTMVHEWLWMYMDNIQDLQMFNGFLHSTDFDTISKSAFNKILKRWKVNVHGSITVLEDGFYERLVNRMYHCRIRPTYEATTQTLTLTFHSFYDSRGYRVGECSGPPPQILHCEVNSGRTSCTNKKGDYSLTVRTKNMFLLADDEHPYRKQIGEKTRSD